MIKIYNVSYVRDQEIRNIYVRKNGKTGYIYSERTRRVHTHIKKRSVLDASEHGKKISFLGRILESNPRTPHKRVKNSYKEIRLIRRFLPYIVITLVPLEYHPLDAT